MIYIYVNYLKKLMAKNGYLRLLTIFFKNKQARCYTYNTKLRM